MSRFKNVESNYLLKNEIIAELFHDDCNKDKINLSINNFINEEGKPETPMVVREAERFIALDESMNKEYFPILGLDSYTNLTLKLTLGEHFNLFYQGKAFSIQTLSDGGALRLIADFLYHKLKYKVIYLSDPHSESFELLFKYSGYTDIKLYRYFDYKNRDFDINGMLEDLRNAPENSVIILQNAAHIPTGLDPSIEEWKEIAEVMASRNHFPVFHNQCQGLASGSFEKDIWPIKYFIEEEFELFVANTYSLNFGIHNERIGSLVAVVSNPNSVKPMKTCFSELVKGLYTSPPSNGARIVTYILNNDVLFEELKYHVLCIYTHMVDMRKNLVASLEELNLPMSWNYVERQTGNHVFFGFTEEQHKYLMDRYSIYMGSNGRMCLYGLNLRQIETIISAICTTLLSIPRYKPIRNFPDLQF